MADSEVPVNSETAPRMRPQSTVRQPCRDDYDFVVIGAGVAGSLAACLAARQGMRVLLVERQRFPRAKVCGCCLNSRAQQLLQQAGLADGLQALQPVPTSVLRLQYRGRGLSLPMPGGLVVSRSRLDAWLVTEAVQAGAEFLDETSARVMPLADSGRESGSGATETVNATALRHVTLNSGTSPTAAAHEHVVSARVVLACDGLAMSSLSLLPEFHSEVSAGARIGLGATFPGTPQDSQQQPNEILMAVASQGYCGMVLTEDQQWNLAAAVDSRSLQRCGSPLNCLRDIFHSAGVVPPQGLDTAVVRGTIPLTRRTSSYAGTRLLLLGDTTGYVEPFTGEGMAWAITAATIAVPLAMRTLSLGWSRDAEHEYSRRIQRCVMREQGVCRALSSILSHPLLLRLTFAGASLLPAVTRTLIRRVNRLPRQLEPIE
ncbi:MAG: hypothetical protein RLZZ232_951 [Planctomycetota bacterium]|jgi:flavin-dependent dehydrogenase